MDTAPTGLGLFTRPGGGDSTPPTAIALDLGLRAAGPDAGKPWACRVTVALRHPSADGLARNVGEIERLSTLGRALVAALGTSARFAAVVTTGGSRTWLLYVAAPDATAAEVAVRSAAATAFGVGPEYAPTVSVTADESWAGYDAVYPTADELARIAHERAESHAVTAARTATHANLKALRAAGTDLTRPGPVRYTMTVARDDAAAPLAQRAAADGFRVVTVGPTVTLTRDDLPDLALILRTERWLIGEAMRTGGKYDGWQSAT